jgi:putative nucleotidyltransferase with HDIG domain
MSIDPQALQAAVRELPALPQALSDLLAALQREDVAMEQLALKIACDQALTAKTLRLANCSFYGVAGRVHSIRDAINVLGLRSLSSALTAAALSGSFARPRCDGFDFDAYWRHSTASALCAQSLARALKIDEAAAFTAALLHDIGRLALASHFPVALSQALRHRAAHDCQLFHAERQVLGTDHAELGALIAEHWRFAPAIVDAIRRHHAPPDDGGVSLLDIVHVADNIAHALDICGEPDELVPPLSLSAWTRLALSPEQYRQIFERTEWQLNDLCEALTV